MSLTQERLRELLLYLPETGEFIWLQSRGHIRRGSRAGTLDASNGYVKIIIDRARFYAHRLAVFYMTGRWPIAEVDHECGDRADNRWAMLREATRQQNGRNLPIKKNNTSGCAGVSYNTQRSRWDAYIFNNRVKKSLGRFDDFESARAARKEAEEKLFGQFARSEVVR